MKIDYKNKTILSEEEVSQNLVESYVAETKSAINADIAVTRTALIKAEAELKCIMQTYPWNSEEYIDLCDKVNGYKSALTYLEDALTKLGLK